MTVLNHAAAQPADTWQARSVSLRRSALGAGGLAAGVLADVAIVLTVLAGRLAMVIWRPPSLTVDESAQFAISRFLSGRGRWSLFDIPTWQPGLGTLLAPIEALGADQHTLFRSALAVNCLFGGVAAALLGRLLARVTQCSPGRARCVAVVISLLPASISGSAFVWGDAAVSAAFLAVVWLALDVAEQPRLGSVLTLQGVASLGYLFHDRMLPIAFVVTVGALAAIWRRGLRQTVCVVSFAIASFGAVEAYTRWVTSNVWEHPSAQNSVRSTLGRAWPPQHVFHTLVGQTWYLAAGTLGIAIVGGNVILRSLWLSNARKPQLTRQHAVVICVLVTAMFATSVLFMSGRQGRADFVIYGRYNDAVMPIVLGVGAATVLGLGAVSWGQVVRICATPVSVILLTTLWVGAFHGDELRYGWLVFSMVPAVVAIAGGPSLEVFIIGLVALAGFGLLVASTRTRLAWLLPCLTAAILLSVGNMRYYGPQMRGLDDRRGLPSVIAGFVPTGSTIGVRHYDASIELSDPVLQRSVQSYQFWLSGYEFKSADLDALPTYVLSLPDDVELRERGGSIVWSNPYATFVVWQTPSSP